MATRNDNRPPGYLEIQRASLTGLDSPEWLSLTTRVIKLDVWMVPAVQEVVRRQRWQSKPNPIGFIKTAAYQEANRLQLHAPRADEAPAACDETESDTIPMIGSINEAYPKFIHWAQQIAKTGLPKELTVDDLAQEAAFRYLKGKVKSKRDAKRRMIELIRNHKFHGTCVTEGEKGDRGRSKKERWRHIVIDLDSMPAKGAGIQARVIAQNILDRLPENQAKALAYVEFLGYSQEETAKIMGLDQPRVSRLITAARKSGADLRILDDTPEGFHVSEVPDDDRPLIREECAAGKCLAVDAYTKDPARAGLVGHTRIPRPGRHNLNPTGDEGEQPIGRDKVSAERASRSDRFSTDSLTEAEERHKEWKAERADMWAEIRESEPEPEAEAAEAA